MNIHKTHLLASDVFPDHGKGLSRSVRLPARIQHHWITGRQQPRMKKALNLIEAIRTGRITDEQAINNIARDYKVEFERIANEP